MSQGWPSLAFSGLAEAVWGVSQVPASACLQSLALQVVVAVCWRQTSGASGSALSGRPGCWQVLLAWGQVILNINWPLWLS